MHITVSISRYYIW